MPAPAVIAAVSGGGRSFVPPTPTLSYQGSYLTNAGKWTISSFSSAVEYTVSGGSLSGSTLTVTATTGSATITAKSPKGLAESSARVAYRKAPDQTSVAFTQCYNPCGNCNTSVNPNTWSCGCGSGCNDSGGGQWGPCICRGPGYSYWNNYAGSGYSWSGGNYASDGSNGEWYKVA